jgi:hypothetical protein
MERMIDSCIAADITPVVLTPFVYGSRYSMRSGRSYANALRELIANRRGAILVDCIELLRPYPKRAILQHDGFHLSRNGHAIVGLAIAQRITSHWQRFSNAPQPPANLPSLKGMGWPIAAGGFLKVRLPKTSAIRAASTLQGLTPSRHLRLGSLREG